MLFLVDNNFKDEKEVCQVFGKNFAKKTLVIGKEGKKSGTKGTKKVVNPGIEIYHLVKQGEISRNCLIRRIRNCTRHHRQWSWWK